MSDESNETTSDDPTDGADPVAPEAIEDAAVEATTDDASTEADEAAPVSDRKAKADAAVAARNKPPASSASATVTRRTVTSRRVTPKGGAAPAPSTGTSKARDAKKTESVVTRSAVPPTQQVYSKGPSPWYVPAIMFGLLILGAAIIMANYMGAFGDASNIRLVIGLAFILGGIVTATQYR